MSKAETDRSVQRHAGAFHLLIYKTESATQLILQGQSLAQLISACGCCDCETCLASKVSIKVPPPPAFLCAPHNNTNLSSVALVQHAFRSLNVSNVLVARVYFIRLLLFGPLLNAFSLLLCAFEGARMSDGFRRVMRKTRSNLPSFVGV
jgi:hypothetical protein